MPSLFSLTAWQNHNNPTDRRHRQGRRRPDLDLDQGTNGHGGSGVSLPSDDFGGTAQGTCLSGLGHQLQHETRPMYEVNAGHVFHFCWGAKPKWEDGTWKVTLMALQLRRCWRIHLCDSWPCDYKSLIRNFPLRINQSIHLSALPSFPLPHHPQGYRTPLKCHFSPHY
jgi:hypothetical protein